VSATAPSPVPRTPCPPSRRGGDRWYNARPSCLCFRAAAVVHRLGEAGTAEVAEACGVTRNRAYELLIACARKPHLYHLRRVGPGRYAALPR
jgi:hypothetical protein